MPGEIEKVAELEGQVTDLEAQVSDLTKKLEKASESEGNEIVAQLDEATKSLAEAADAIEKLTQERDDLAVIAKMSEDEKDYCKNMSPEEKSAFLSKDPEERRKDMSKRAAADESVTIEGNVIRKSAVGEAVFNVMKAQADRIAKSEKDLEVEKQAREKIQLEKQAEEKYPHVPGTTEERGQMLGVIQKLGDEVVRKAFEKVFEQSEKLAANGFAKIGSSDAGKPSDKIAKAAKDFDSKVSEIKKRDNCTRTEALAKARKENPELFAQYQDSEATS